MQSATCVSVKCNSNNIGVGSCDSGNLKVLSYSASLWVARYELTIRLWVGSCISLHYIKPALSVYIISSLHVKQSKSDKVMWCISVMTMVWIWKQIASQKNLSIARKIAHCRLKNHWILWSVLGNLRREFMKHAIVISLI